jgi:hypothetical protein
MHGYQRKGFGSRILSPISGAIIEFIGEIYVDDTDLIVTQPELKMETAVQEELQLAAGAWSAGLNATGGTINPKKSHWILADNLWTNGEWGYSKQPMVPMEIPLPDGSTANIVHRDALRTVEKALGVWAAVDGNDDRHLTENVTG